MSRFLFRFWRRHSQKGWFRRDNWVLLPTLGNIDIHTIYGIRPKRNRVRQRKTLQCSNTTQGNKTGAPHTKLCRFCTEMLWSINRVFASRQRPFEAIRKRWCAQVLSQSSPVGRKQCVQEFQGIEDKYSERILVWTNKRNPMSTDEVAPRTIESSHVASFLLWTWAIVQISIIILIKTITEIKTHVRGDLFSYFSSI